jgi:GT2 family glycosyltransferase
MNISIIIPNLNGAKLLCINLPKVLKAVTNYTKGSVEIIIADDPSTDNSREVIRHFISTIKEKNITGKIIENRSMKESGFSKNVNRGVSLATGDILILLNSDVSPEKDFLRPLLRYFDDPKVFAVACMDESHENDKPILRGRGIGLWHRGFFMHRAGKLDKNNTLWVSGGSGAFRKKIWDTLHGLDPLFNPFYWEDIDLSYRALKSGYKIFFEPKSIVVHEHEKGVIKNRYKTEQIKKIAYRNQFIFIWKNITQTELLVMHIIWLPYHFIKALFTKDKPFIAGFFLALMQISQIRKSRRFARKYFVKTDMDIIKEHSK